MMGYRWVDTCHACPHPPTAHRVELVTNGVEDLLYLECPGCERDEEKKHGDDYDPHVHVVPSCVEITLTGEQHITTQETRDRVLKLDLDMFGKNALGETGTPKPSERSEIQT